MSRRDILKAGIFAGAGLALPIERVLAGQSLTSNRIAASLLPKPFVTQYRQPPVAVPFRKDATTDYYRFTMQMVQAEVIPGLKTQFMSYNGSVPGPTIKATQGRRVVVRHVNGLPAVHPTLGYVPWTSVHLHGSASDPAHDGYASQITQPGEYKDYIYPNYQPARTLWYHDHGVHHTAQNAYQGLAAQYHLADAQEAALGLPTGQYDLPIIIHDKLFNADGSLLFTLDNMHGQWGDVIMVNDVAWPNLKVAKRKYRFRVLNASISRSYNWGLSNGATFHVIATDGGLTPAPIAVTKVRHGMAERYDIVIDFSKYATGTKIVLTNTNPTNNTVYPNTDKIMQFEVTADPFDKANNNLPAKLNPNNPVMALTAAQAVKTRTFNLINGNEWSVNGTTWKKIEASNFTFLEADPALGTVEKWIINNPSGGWFHPLHVHLVDFKVLSRNGKAPFAFEGGPKDVVYVGENESVELLMRFEDVGKYMVHCHNLIHEDHDMMTQFAVIDPTGKRVKPDPMDPSLGAFPLSAEGPL